MKKLNQFFVRPGIILTAILLSSTVFLSSCEPQPLNEPVLELSSELNVVTANQRSSKALLNKELAELRAAVAQFRDFEVAIAAGYEILPPGDYVPQMGVHYINFSLVDENFEITKPEVLIFAENEDGEMRFVGVEYATPETTPKPEGFTGSTDEWVINGMYHVWTLHVWVGLHNPNGIFAMNNPRL